MSGRVFVGSAPYGDAQKTEEAVGGLLRQLPAFSRVGPDTNVFIKPNLLARHAPEAAVTTHPHVLRAVILAVQRQGCTSITVADSPGGPYTEGALRATYKTCGFTSVCEETGAALYLGNQGVKRPFDGKLVRSFELLRPAAEADFIINLPKMKTHVLMGMTGAVKNLFGLAPGLQKAEFHTRFPNREHFGEMLVDLCEAVHADIHLVDGLLAMEGDGPGSGSPRRCDVLFAGEDPYLIDLALCRTMAMQPMNIPYLAAAHARGLCPAALPDGALVGDVEAADPIPDFKPPRSYTGRVDFSGSVPAVLRPLVARTAAWAAPKPVIRRQTCIGCGRCVDICPRHTVHLQNKKAVISYENCIKCFCCHEICPARAIDVRRNGFFKL